MYDGFHPLCMQPCSISFQSQQCRDISRRSLHRLRTLYYELGSRRSGTNANVNVNGIERACLHDGCSDVLHRSGHRLPDLGYTGLGDMERYQTSLRIDVRPFRARDKLNKVACATGVATCCVGVNISCQLSTSNQCRDFGRPLARPVP